LEKLHIQTARLLIRHLVVSNLKDFHSYRSNPEVTKHQGFDIMDKTQTASFIIDNATKFFGTPGEGIQYAIENKETNTLIGDCAI